MTPERWQQVKELFRSAQEKNIEERAAFLERACDGDESLRQEVESLLASFADSDSIIERPLASAAAELFAGDQSRSMLGKRLGRYEIIALLGEGGMGRVYLAQDARLGRKVALKLLPPYFTGDQNRLYRFEQEARAASALNHPNIITIHEIGESDSGRYLVTEFVDGQTLRERLTQSRMGLPEALAVVTQVASALAAAHEAGIVHRDIKPENLMIRRDSLVKVLDFGLAKLAESQSPAVDTQAATAIKTEAGVVMGTARYMSPEQARGQKVDARTDIFSLGVVLHEAITGRSPFSGETASDVIAAILTTEPPPLTDSGSEVPRELERIVGKCLKKDREQRYISARELLADLNSVKRDLEGWAPVGLAKRRVRRLIVSRGWLALAVLAVFAVAALSYLLLFRRAPAAVSPEIKSLAVLPLENLSGDPAQEYFADGMTEALISNLAQIRALKVISRTSVMRYKGLRKSLPEIARELNVDAVIEGTVQRSGGRVRVTAQLIYAATDAHLWARDYERDLTDVLKLQSDVAREVADEIRIQVTAAERARLASARSVNPQAHEAYLLGRYHLNKGDEQGWKQASEYFERAIQLAPDYAAAYAGLSDTWLRRGIFGAKDFKESESPSRAAAMKARELDEQLAEAHISLANIKTTYDWDWTGAELEARRALELDPGSLEAHTTYGHLLMALGRHNEAIREGRIALELDPLSASTQSALGRFLYRARRYEESLPHLKRAVELEPRDIGANARLGELYAQLGRYEEAIAAFQKITEQRPDDGNAQAEIARVYALMGREREARQMISRVKAQPIIVADVYAALGDKDQAFGVLEKAVEERSSYLIYVKESPALENLHSDPRWKALLSRMNFPPE